jgi:ADP-ribose pyrophosphatase YjhB (NUDIX family)
VSSNDPRLYPDRPWVGVGVVVRREGEILLVRRAKPPRQGEWGIPGGAQELGETIFETAIREVFEETGLTVAPVGIVTAVDAIHRAADRRISFHFTLIEVAADFVAGEATPRSDIDAVRWVAPDKAAELVQWAETLRVIALATPPGR